MIDKFLEKNSKYIFNTIITIIIISSYGLYYFFGNTSTYIQKVNLNSNINYIENITSNIEKFILEETNKDIYKSLKNSKDLRIRLEKTLQMFLTPRYRYLYIVDKVNINDEYFRFLLDGSKDINEKSEFEEVYEPLNIKKWNSVYKLKKSIYFKHNNIKSIWLTYLKPIIVNNQVKAIIVIDFSLHDHISIMKALSLLDKTLLSAVIFSMFLLFVIIFFAYLDKKRLLELRKKSQQISLFNKTLQEKIAKEVAKNREKDKQIIQQSRLAQMGEMISMIAHQWRQPLAAISSTTSTIILKATLNKLENTQAIELATKISDYTQHLSSTINDFRDFFKPTKEKKDTSYNEIINSTLDIIETSLVNNNIKIVKDLKSTKVLHTYPNELKQVLLNLLKNSKDALLEKKIKDPYIKIETYGNILQVSDNAGGISAEILDKIFDPYFTTKDEKNGTGLGLYMSKTIIQEHCNGNLSVKNSADGAVFTIEL